MRYASIRSIDVSNGEGIGVALFVQGCSLHCKGCFNTETWDFNGGEPITPAIECKIYNLLKSDHITRFSVLGGEPLEEDNLYQLNYILCTIKSVYPQKKIWIWTGYTWDELQERREKNHPDKLLVTFKYADYLVAGPFIEEEKDLTLLWRGSRNQEIIDLQKTKEQGKKVLYEEQIS